MTNMICAGLRSLDEVDPELLRTFDRLGIPLAEQKRLTNVAVDAVFDSVSIATTFKKELSEHGIIFMSISEAVHTYPELVRKHLGSVVRCLLCILRYSLLGKGMTRIVRCLYEVNWHASLRTLAARCAACAAACAAALTSFAGAASGFASEAWGFQGRSRVACCLAL